MKKILMDTICNKKICKLVLFVYIGLLSYFVIFKLYLPKENVIFARELILRNRAAGYYNANLIPFKSIRAYINPTLGINYINLLGNTLPFIFLGVLTAIQKNNKTNVAKLLLFNILLIVGFEIMQFVTCVGVLDIDDIILNSISCYIGIIVYLKAKSKLVK